MARDRSKPTESELDEYQFALFREQWLVVAWVVIWIAAVYFSPVRIPDWVTVVVASFGSSLAIVWGRRRGIVRMRRTASRQRD